MNADDGFRNDYSFIISMRKDKREDCLWVESMSKTCLSRLTCFFVHETEHRTWTVVRSNYVCPIFYSYGEIRAEFSQLENQKCVPVCALRMKTKPGQALKLSRRKSYTYISVRSLFLSVNLWTSLRSCLHVFLRPKTKRLIIVSPPFHFCLVYKPLDPAGVGLG